ncbi:TonB family protein [Pseudoduganella sp. CY13W]|uniref:TonB family protein n=2 Tax=Duganella qianjiadongensis TaxID=2692176 RepID=A0ABW9VEV3_9BURK|nr:TonB family protein [Duganella qianjiadongensis]
MRQIRVVFLPFFALLSPFVLAQAKEQKAATVFIQGYAETEACAPIRPENAAQNTKPRTVKFAFLVDEEGKVQQAKLTKSSGDKLLDKATLDAWANCVFHPASQDGHTRISWVMLSYKWTPALQ